MMYSEKNSQTLILYLVFCTFLFFNLLSRMLEAAEEEINFFRRNEKNYQFAIMASLYCSCMSGPIAITLIFPQLTQEGLVFTIL